MDSFNSFYFALKWIFLLIRNQNLGLTFLRSVSIISNYMAIIINIYTHSAGCRGNYSQSFGMAYFSHRLWLRWRHFTCLRQPLSLTYHTVPLIIYKYLSLDLTLHSSSIRLHFLHAFHIFMASIKCVGKLILPPCLGLSKAIR